MIVWNRIDDGMPEVDTPVFLTKIPNSELKDADLGRLIVNHEDGNSGWFIGNNERVLKVEARNCWIYLNEPQVEIPETENDEDLQPILDHLLARLAFFDEKFRRIAAWMIVSGNGLYTLDYYISGLLNRSLSLIYGFETLVRSGNYIAAAHLARPHLDNYLRLNAAWLTDQPHEFAKKVWEGTPVRKIKDRDGKLMHDTYLRKKQPKHILG